jgi:predicted permease
VIALAGAVLRRLIPSLDVDATPRQCGTLVLNIMLPGLNIKMIYPSSPGSHLWQIPVAMLVGAVACVCAAALVFFLLPLDRNQSNLAPCSV